jgi:hypothetical protein
MKIPKKIKIAGFVWTLEQSTEHKRDVTREGLCYGSTHHSTQKFFIDPDITRQKTEHTFLHEVLHAIWFHYGLSKNKSFTPDMEELVVDSLSNGLYQVLNDNHLLK